MSFSCQETQGVLEGNNPFKQVILGANLQLSSVIMIDFALVYDGALV